MVELTDPITFTKTDLVTSYVYSIYNYQVHTSAQYTIYLRDASDNTVKEITGTIEGDTLANWGTDDTYIDNLMQNEVNKLKN